MKPEKALELVTLYSTLTRQIQACLQRIGDSLELCDTHGGHLGEWYKRPAEAETEYGDYGQPIANFPGGEWLVPGPEQQAECAHCFAANLVVQERKLLRKRLAHVKAAMTRATKSLIEYRSGEDAPEPW